MCHQLNLGRSAARCRHHITPPRQLTGWTVRAMQRLGSRIDQERRTVGAITDSQQATLVFEDMCISGEYGHAPTKRTNPTIPGASFGTQNKPRATARQPPPGDSRSVT
jgi:hypothetical protein